MYTSLGCCFDLAGRMIMFKASLLCLTAESLPAFPSAPSSLTLLWRWAEHRNLTTEWAVPSGRGALPFPSMTAFARAVHSSSNSVVLWVSSSARQTDLQLAEHLQAKFFMFSRLWMLPNCTGKMGTGDYLCIAMSGGAPWGFRLQGGKEQKQPLQIAKVGAWQRCCWSFVGTDDRSTLFKSILLPGKWWGSCCDACLHLLTGFTEILQVLILSVSIKKDYYFWVAGKFC